MGSVDKALLVLDALVAAGPGGVTLARLSDSLGLHKTTLHRTLAALRHRGYAEQHPVTGTYALGPAALALGRAGTGHGRLPALLGPAMRALCDATGELVHLGVLQGGQVLYLDKVEPPRPIRVWSAVGLTRPAALTAMGRALLSAANLPPAIVASYAEPLRRPEDLAIELRAARRRGYALEREENEPGISCIGVGLDVHGVVAAALSVTAPSERMRTTRMGELRALAQRVVPPLLPPGFALVGSTRTGR